MKYTMSFLWLALLVLAGCAKEEAIDFEKERAAIISVITAETDAYLRRDFEAVYDAHVHDSMNMRLTAGADNYVFLEGWDEVKRHLGSDDTEDDLSPELHISVKKDNWRMKICEKSAFVVCDQTWTSAYGTDTAVITSIQVRFMEKIEGEWKISFVSFIGTSGYAEQEEVEILD
ncbi:MAG: hypothetical protein R2751_04770 [Bacteroidales bacterium]